MLQVYFIRHGQSTNNVLMDDGGGNDYLRNRDIDPDLTSKGERQARLVAELLSKPSCNNGFDPQNRAGFGLTHLYCSLMTRAIKTGQVISEKLGIPLVAWTDLHETGGIYEIKIVDDQPVYKGKPGPSKSYFNERFPELLLPDDLSEQGWWGKEKEPREFYLERAQRIVERLVEVHGETDDRVGIITHGGIFARILTSMFDLHAKHYWFLMNNCGITRVDIRDGCHFMMAYMNKVEFLPDDLIT